MVGIDRFVIFFISLFGGFEIFRAKSFLINKPVPEDKIFSCPSYIVQKTRKMKLKTCVTIKRRNGKKRKTQIPAHDPSEREAGAKTGEASVSS